jgi:hypothetical protein
VPVQASFGVRSKIDVEDADLIVGENEVVVGFGGDFDFWLGLRGKERGEKQEEYEAVHCGDCSIGQVVELPSAGQPWPAEDGGLHLNPSQE